MKMQMNEEGHWPQSPKFFGLFHSPYQKTSQAGARVATTQPQQVRCGIDKNPNTPKGPKKKERTNDEYFVIKSGFAATWVTPLEKITLPETSTKMSDEINRRGNGSKSQKGEENDIEMTALEVNSMDSDDELFDPLMSDNSSVGSGMASSKLAEKVGNGTANSADDGGDDDGHGHGIGPPGSATTSQMIINIVISFVGAGLLGIPYAFSKSGWLLGSVALVTVSALNVYALLRLPAVQHALNNGEKARVGAERVSSYGDLGRVIMGARGERLVHICLGISQAGFATAYIIFIAANLKTIGDVPRWVVCFACLPGLAVLVQFRDMKSLSPFSLLANTANFSAMGAVLLQDYKNYQPHNDKIHAAQWDGLVYVIAITIYSMEGAGMVLSLKASSQKPAQFPGLLSSVMVVVTIFMAVFGSAGYWAFGDLTEAPITLNLSPDDWSATFVKLALCLGLYLTYPIMMFPLWNIYEDSIQEEKIQRSLRVAVVFVSCFVAYSVPNFGMFLSLVGSSICTLLGFILPCAFHLYVLGDELPLWQYCLDVTLVVGGFIFGCMGTIQSFMAMLKGELESEVRR